MDDFAFQKKGIEVVHSFKEADDADRAYWWSQTVDRRLAYMEHLRRINYGDAATEGLQRILNATRAKRR